jgi:POT family proton-dependent oligopeptide transporter
MLFAPIFSWIWVKLGQKGLEPAAPLKFAIGLGLLASGYFVLFLGKASIANAMMPAIFLVLLYLLHTLGELAVSPVGLSMVTKLSPEKIVGFMMGFWFLSSSIAHQAGKHIANYTAVSEDTSPEQSLTIALDVFWNLGIVAAGAGVLLLVLSPMLSKWMHGIK